MIPFTLTVMPPQQSWWLEAKATKVLSALSIGNKEHGGVIEFLHQAGLLLVASYGHF